MSGRIAVHLDRGLGWTLPVFVACCRHCGTELARSTKQHAAERTADGPHQTRQRHQRRQPLGHLPRRHDGQRQVQHHLRGDGGIYCGTAAREHVAGHLRCDRIRRDGQNYALVGARLGRGFGRVDVFLDGSNLLNESYREIAGVAMPGRWISAGVTIGR